MASGNLPSNSNNPVSAREAGSANPNWPFNAEDLDPARLSAMAGRLQAQMIASMASSLISGLRRLAEVLARLLQRRRDIEFLRSLDDKLLEDIGLNRADIELAVEGKLKNQPHKPSGGQGLIERLPISASNMPKPANANRSGDVAA